MEELNNMIEFNESKIKYGPDWYGEEISESAKGSVEYITRDLSDIKKSYFRLGFHLNECANMRYYEEFGYDNMREFALANFGLDASALSRCIGVFKMTCIYQDFIPTIFQDEKWNGYSYSQLCEMITLPTDKRLRISRNMTVKEIRDYKKTLKQNKNDLGQSIDDLRNTLDQIATSQEKDLLCINDLITLKGAALSARIRKCESVDVKHVSIFDENGKRLMNGLTCDVLLSDENKIIFRVVDQVEFNNGNDEVLKNLGKILSDRFKREG